MAERIINEKNETLKDIAERESKTHNWLQTLNSVITGLEWETKSLRPEIDVHLKKFQNELFELKGKIREVEEKRIKTLHKVL